MLEIIKSFFSPVGGGRTSFASQNGNIQGKEDLRQGRNLVSNSDFNRKRGEEYLISSSFVSENIVGGGQLRSNNYSASSRSIKGGEGNYTSLMSSDFADTKTMLNPNRIVGGGGEIHLDSSIQKGGKPLFRTLRSNIQGLLSTYGCESNDECPYTRNVEGGGRLICHLLGLMFKPSLVGGYGSFSFWDADSKGGVLF